MPDNHKNFAVSTVATAPSPAISGTGLSVTAGHGTRFPAVPFNAIVWPTGPGGPTPANAEVVRVTAIATDAFTIARAQEGSNARTIVGGAAGVGDQIAVAQTVKWWTDVQDALRFKNFLINPDGRINQRAPATNADDTYGHDRWIALTQTGTIAVSTVVDAENGTPRMWRLTQSQAAAQRMGYLQIIESANHKYARGRKLVLSGRIKYSLNAPVRYAILGWAGAVDTFTSDVVLDWTNASYTTGQFFIASNLVVLAVGTITPAAATLVDLTALVATSGSDNNLAVFIWTEGTAAQNATLDGFLQLEEGEYPTQREIRPAAIEFLMCQRYFQKSYAVGTAPGAATEAGCRFFLVGTNTAGFIIASIAMQVTMRASPTIAYWDGAGNASKLTIYNSAGGSSTNFANAFPPDRINDSGFTFPHQNGAGTTAGFLFQFTADAEL